MSNIETRTWNITRVSRYVEGSYYQGHWDWDMSTLIQYETRKAAVNHHKRLKRAGVKTSMAG